MSAVKESSIPCTIMRGGTSKALFFLASDLPADVQQRTNLLLQAFGSPDIRQVDGMGGADPLTSKTAIIRASNMPGVDVEYTFGQVSITEPFVDMEGNCGNISSAVGPFAIDKDLVSAVEPVTTVRIFNTNTKKMIVADVPVREGRVVTHGEYQINGVPGTGAEIKLHFVDPGGAIHRVNDLAVLDASCDGPADLDDQEGRVALAPQAGGDLLFRIGLPPPLSDRGLGQDLVQDGGVSGGAGTKGDALPDESRQRLRGRSGRGIVHGRILVSRRRPGQTTPAAWRALITTTNSSTAALMVANGSNASARALAGSSSSTMAMAGSAWTGSSSRIQNSRPPMRRNLSQARRCRPPISRRSPKSLSGCSPPKTSRARTRPTTG